MAKAYASAIIDAPIETVWQVVRDFNALPSWHPAIAHSEIENGLDSDVVGCIRSMSLKDGTPVRERLLSLDDCRYSFAYNFETPAFPVANYVAEFELIPLTESDRTFAQWSAQFDEKPEDAGKYERIVSRDVFQGGLSALASACAGRPAQAGAEHWLGFRPAKLFCSAVLHAPLATAWARVRDFSGMGEWHSDIRNTRILDGARPDKVSAVRDFLYGDAALQEQLTLLCDKTHAFRYKINKSPMPWLNYHAGVRLPDHREQRNLRDLDRRLDRRAQ